MCLYVPDQCKETPRCDFIDARGNAFLTQCVRVAEWEPVPAEETFPIFPEPIGSKCVCLIDSSL